MNKRLMLILALALVVGLTTHAYAEVQNIKVGGDLTTLAISRYGFNLTKPEDDASGLVAITRVRFDADLTDDVMVTVRLLNERVWGSAEESAANSDMDLDLAYVTLKEFLYSPLTLMVGRQEFRLGSGLLIGDPDTNMAVAAGTGLPAILGDLSTRKAFDAIIGILDYAPLTLTLGYLNINEGTASTTAAPHQGLRANGDDVNVYLVNAAYDFGDNANTMGELYYVVADVGDDTSGTTDDVNNVGIRLVSSPLENLSTSAEFAYQTTRRPTAEGPGHRTDTALLLGANYALPEVKWSPVLGINFVRLSDYWNMMYEDQGGGIGNALFANTDCQVIGLSAMAMPMEDVTASLRYSIVRLIEGLSTAGSNWGTGAYSMNPDKKHASNEWNFNISYAYTEDVLLGLSIDYLDAGKALMNREDASQVIGSMKVTF